MRNGYDLSCLCVCIIYAYVYAYAYAYVYALVVETFSKTDPERVRASTNSSRLTCDYFKTLALGAVQYSFRLNIAFTHLNMLGTGKFGNMEFEELESEWFQMYPGTF